MIPANSELDAEALQMAVSVSEKGIRFFVVTLEHLVALKLKTWRYKDRLHINHLLDSGVPLDQANLSSILERHQLEQRWKQLLAERKPSS
jgi:predicted nucleotidyltransferase